MGARVENVSLRDFLYNPTKICNALRQIHGYLPADGVTCYFDPTLEAEALGANLEWITDSEPPAVHWPGAGESGTFDPGLARVEEVARNGRIPTACEVIRRLKSTGAHGRLLMACITGPFSLASRLGHDVIRTGQVGTASPAFEFGCSLITEIARRYVEAGANVIFVVEDALPSISAGEYEQWASLLAPAFNIVRFYEALPVLLLTDGISVAANRTSLFGRQWDCLLCPHSAGLDMRTGPSQPGLAQGLLGLAASLELFNAGELECLAHIGYFREQVSALTPVAITTAGDLPPGADLKRASRVLSELKILL